jgi:chromosome segregation ATPase
MECPVCKVELKLIDSSCDNCGTANYVIDRIKELEEDIADLTTSLVECEKQRLEVEARVAELEEENKYLQGNGSFRDKAIEAFEKENTTLKSSVAELEGKIDEWKKNWEDQARYSASLEGKIDDIEETIKELQEAKTFWHNEYLWLKNKCEGISAPDMKFCDVCGFEHQPEYDCNNSPNKGE